MRFSERVGAVTVPDGLLIEEVSQALRNSIWNVVHRHMGDHRSEQLVAQRFAREFFKLPVDHVPGPFQATPWMHAQVDKLEWWGVYDLAEYMATKFAPGPGTAKEFNEIFEEERSGYRFVNGSIIPITDEREIAAIERAARSAGAAGLEGAAIHISSAVAALSQKPKPDYRRCVQEAIHAVESVAVRINGRSENTLDKALKALAPKAGIHRALQGAFGQMYGYTSDADGIRHAIIDAPTVDFADAEYMLVSCSAFVHYLIQKAGDAGLLKPTS